jgi:hypothetical protein
MKKLISILFLFFNILCVDAQSFIDNPDYTYGEGRANTLEEADKLAFADLVNQLRIEVSVSSDLSLSDYNGKIDRKYGEKIKTSSGIKLSGTTRYIDDEWDGKGYRVYRYFNKTKYVNDRKEKASKYLELAEENYYGSEKNGTINITLGHYYLAYQCVDDELFILLNGSNDVFKAQIIDKTKQLLDIIKLEFRPASKFHGYFTPYDEKAAYYDPNNFHVSIYLNNYIMCNIDFEYWDGVRWSYAYKKNEAGDIFEIKTNGNIPRSIKGLKYRIVYQTYDENNKKIKLFVPDDFYTIGYGENVDKETINRWIAIDKKNNLYN